MHAQETSLIDVLCAKFGGGANNKYIAAGSIAGLFIPFPDGESVIILQLTYRDNLVWIVEPTSEEVTTFRKERLWDLWNSHRTEPVGGILRG